jgi:hypothetical protein
VHVGIFGEVDETAGFCKKRNSVDTSVIVREKKEFVPVFNQLSTTPQRRMEQWMYRSTFA